MTHEQKAVELLSHLRVHDATRDGPGYGSVKAMAAVAYAILALAEVLRNK